MAHRQAGEAGRLIGAVVVSGDPERKYERLSRSLAVIAVLVLVFAACGDDDPIAFEPSTTAATVAPQAPFDVAVGVVLELPADEVFALLDSLADDQYFALLDEVGVDGDVQFVDALDYTHAAALVDRLDAALFDELLALAESGLDPNVESPVTTAAAAPPPGTVAAADVRHIDGGDLGRKGRVMVEVGPGDLSFLAFARTGNPNAQVFVTGVVSPSGVDVGDAIGLEYGELSNFGEAAFYAPITPAVGLETGQYAVAFEATAEIVESGALVRSGSVQGPQALDVVFWMATHEQFDRVALEERFRTVGDAVLSPHGIVVGSITFVDAPPDIVDRYSTLRFVEGGSDDDLRGLCREMSASIGGVRALEFALVDRLDGDDPDSIIEGSSSGLPGTAMLAGSDLSCVAGMAAPDPDEPGRDLFARAIVVWHEAGHHLGLYHTTEGDGEFFDLIEDTPECHADERDSNDDGFVDLFECDGLDADNFMFYDGDGTVMTAGQAWMIRRHPLLYPVEP